MVTRRSLHASVAVLTKTRMHRYWLQIFAAVAVAAAAAAWTHLAWGTVTTAGSRSNSHSNRSEARSVPFLRSCKHASVDAGYALVPCHKRRYMIDLFVTDVIPSVICYLFGPTQQYKVYASGVFRKI